jgi:hypothetical protein
MSTIILSGLAGSHPLGALAAFGVLRCCHETGVLGTVRLAWQKEADWWPELHTSQPVTAEDLIGLLLGRVAKQSERPELHWAANIKTTPVDYRKAAEQAMEAASPTCRQYADFLAAFTCQLATTPKGDLEPTAFYMTSGRQEFLKEVRSLASRVSQGRPKKRPEEMFREALFGPWRYDDPQHSLGWDPSTERLHALRGKSPTKESSQGVAGAVWLAFEALPLFPCFLSGGRLATRGFSRVEGRTFFTWPIWEEPASLAEVSSMLALKELTWEKPPVPELRRRGVAAVFRCERYKVKTQGNYHIFRPAFPCT